jgi:ACT domain-containing protein
MNEMRKVVISILGADRKGIIANVTRVLYEHDANILDISQTIISGLFSMILIADISSEHCSFEQLKKNLTELGDELNVQVRVQRSEIFEAMHQV